MKTLNAILIFNLSLFLVQAYTFISGRPDYSILAAGSTSIIAVAVSIILELWNLDSSVILKKMRIVRIQAIIILCSVLLMLFAYLYK